MEAGVTEESTMLRLPDLSRLTLQAAPVCAYPLSSPTADYPGGFELSAGEVYGMVQDLRDRFKAFYVECRDGRKTVDQINWFLKTSKPELSETGLMLDDQWYVNDSTYNQDKLRLKGAREMHKQAFLLRRWIGLYGPVQLINSKYREVENFDYSQRKLEQLQTFVDREQAALDFYAPTTTMNVTGFAGSEYESLRLAARATRRRAVKQLESLRQKAWPLWRPDFNRAGIAANDNMTTAAAAQGAQRAATGGPGSSGGRAARRELAVGELVPAMQVVLKEIKDVLETVKNGAKDDHQDGAVLASASLDLTMAKLGTFVVEARRRTTGRAVDAYVSWTDMAGNPTSIAKSGIDVEWRWGNKLRSEPEIINFLDWLWYNYLSKDDQDTAVTWSMNPPKSQ